MFANFKIGRGRTSSKDVSEKTLENVTVLEVGLTSPTGSPPKYQEPVKRTPTEPTIKRKISLAAVSDMFRRGSTATSSLKSEREPSPVRKHSISSFKNSSFWESRNPDIDSCAPRNKSTSSTSSSSPDLNGRRPSYVPRNAASSFRRTTTTREHTNTDPSAKTTDLPGAADRRGSVNINGRRHSLVAANGRSGSSTRRSSTGLAYDPNRPSQPRSSSISEARQSIVGHIADRRPQLAASLAGETPLRRPSDSSERRSSLRDGSDRRSSVDRRASADRRASTDRRASMDRKGSAHSRSRGTESPKRTESYSARAMDAQRMWSVSEVDGELVLDSPPPTLEAMGFRGAVPVSAA